MELAVVVSEVVQLGSFSTFDVKTIGVGEPESIGLAPLRVVITVEKDVAVEVFVSPVN